MAQMIFVDKKLNKDDWQYFPKRRVDIKTFKWEGLMLHNRSVVRKVSENFINLRVEKNHKEKDTFGKKLLQQEIDIAEKAGAKFYIAHFSWRDSLTELGKIYNQLSKQQRQLLTLELDASRLVDSQKFLEDFLTIKQQLGIKLCLDTAHLYSSGLCKTIEDLQRFVKTNGKFFDVIHLNDQEFAYGLGQDKHAQLFSGKMLGQCNVQKAAKFVCKCIDTFDNIILEFRDIENQTLNAIKDYKANKIKFDRQHLQSLIGLIRAISVKCIEEKTDQSKISYSNSSQDQSVAQQKFFKFRAYDQMVSFLKDWLDSRKDQFFDLQATIKKFGLTEKFKILSFISLLPNIHLHKDFQLTNSQQAIAAQLNDGLKLEQLGSRTVRPDQRIQQKQAKHIIVKFLKLIDVQPKDATICGSIRREAKYNIGDIDLLFNLSLQKHIKEQLDQAENVQVESWGKICRLSYKYNAVEAIHIDIVFATQNEMACALLYLTGSRYFTVNIRQRAKKLGLKLTSFNMFNVQGKQIQVKSEEDIFKTLHMNYVNPRDRITWALDQWNIR